MFAAPLFIQSLLYLYLSQYLPDWCRNRQLRTNFSGCCTLIDHHQMFSSEIINKSCCRINDQGRTTYDQRICFTYCLHTLIDHSRIKTFLIKYNIRFEHSTAAASRDSVCMFYISRIVEFMAFHAVIAMNTSVQFQYIFASCLLMKSVNILRDHGS